MGKSASEEAKSKGFKSLSAVAALFGVTTQCLRNWHAGDHKKFKIVLLGCASYLNESEDVNVQTKSND